MASYLDIGRAD